MHFLWQFVMQYFELNIGMDPKETGINLSFTVFLIWLKKKKKTVSKRAAQTTFMIAALWMNLAHLTPSRCMLYIYDTW